MNARILTIFGSFLVLFGAVLLYDSAFVFFIKKILSSRNYFGFDFKEFIIGLLFASTGAFVLFRTPKKGNDEWSLALGLLLFGLFTPVLFSFNIGPPMWFTDRQMVTVMSGDTRGEKILIRTRNVQFQDEDDPRAVRSTSAALDSSVAMARSRPLTSGAANTVRAEEAVPKSLPEPVDPLSASLESSVKSKTVSDWQSLPLGERVSDDLEMQDACGNGNDILPESMALVEKATGSVNGPSMSYGPEAELLLERAISLDAKNTIAYSRLGQYYLKFKKRPLTAIDVYKRALIALPGCNSLYFDIGNAYSSNGDYPEAKRQLAKAIQLTEDIPASYFYNLGNAYLKSGDAKDSIAHYLDALKADPAHANARKNLARAYIAERRISELQEMYADDAEALRRIGVTINREKDHETALLFFEQSLAVKEDVETYVHIGIANGLLKRNGEARVAAEKALTLKPGHEGALTVLRLLDNKRTPSVKKQSENAVRKAAGVEEARARAAQEVARDVAQEESLKIQNNTNLDSRIFLLNDKMYKSIAKPTLSIRSSASVKSEKIGKIPENELVKVLASTGKIETIGGKQGEWRQIEYKGITGYVFDAFLVPN